MISAGKSRTHLIERAAETLGGLAGLIPGTPIPGAQLQGTHTPIADRLGLQPESFKAAAGADERASRLAVGAEALERAGLILSELGRSRMSEEIAIISNQVRRVALGQPQRGGQDPRLVLVTSARPGEGKSFTSMNMAGAMAIAGSQPVLLVDADGKRGSLSELLGLSEEAGLRALATAPSQRPASLIVPTMHEFLSVLPYGQNRAAPTPSASLAPAIRGLAAAMPRHIIIIDAPPCLSISEASMLAPIVGQALVVVEAEKTSRSDVEATLDMIDSCPILQVMLNKAQFNLGSTFGSSGYGAYGDAYYHAPNDDK